MFSIFAHSFLNSLEPKDVLVYSIIDHDVEGGDIPSRYDDTLKIHALARKYENISEPQIQKKCQGLFVVPVYFTCIKTQTMYLPPSLTSLRHQIQNYDLPLDTRRIEIIKNLYLAIRLIHQRGYTHNQLSLDSIYLAFSPNNSDFTLQIGDFSAAREKNGCLDTKKDLKNLREIIRIIIKWKLKAKDTNIEHDESKELLDSIDKRLSDLIDFPHSHPIFFEV